MYCIFHYKSDYTEYYQKTTSSNTKTKDANITDVGICEDDKITKMITKIWFMKIVEL